MDSEFPSVRFATSTIMGRQQQKKVNQVIQTLIDSPDSIDFRNPVDWQAFGLVNYPAIIKKPMDLNTAKRNLNAAYYQQVQGCLADIQLIWDNCKLFNGKQAWISKLADKLQKTFKKMIKNYLPFVILQGSNQQKKQLKKQKQPQIKQAKNKLTKIPKQAPKDFEEQQKDRQQMEPQIAQDPAISKRRTFILFLGLCSPQQLGLIFMLLQRNCPDVIQVQSEQAQSVNIHAQKIDDSMIQRMMEQFDVWRIGYQNFTTTNKKK